MCYFSFPNVFEELTFRQNREGGIRVSGRREDGGYFDTYKCS